jgi:hypothetical protein
MKTAAAILGFVVLNETPKLVAGNKLVAFLPPKGTNVVLIELCQEMTHKDTARKLRHKLKKKFAVNRN